MSSDYWRILSGARASTFAAVFFATVSGMGEASGLALLLPLLSANHEDRGRSILLLAALVSLLVTSTLAKFLADRLVATSSTRIERDCRDVITRGLMFGSWVDIGRLTQGEVAAAVMVDAVQVGNGVTALLYGMGSGIVAICLAATSAVLSPSMFMLTALFAVVSILIVRMRLKRVRRNERRISDAQDSLGEDVSSILSDLRYLRTSGDGHSWLAIMAENSARLRNARFNQLQIPVATRTVIDSLGAFVLTVVLAIALLRENLASGLVFLALFYRVMPRLQAAQGYFTAASGQREWLHKYWDRCAVLLPETLPPPVDTPVTEAVSTITLENLSFTYPGRSDPAINNVTLHLPVGRSLAIIGESGAGKSTLIELLVGLLRPDRGAVLINGVDLSTLNLDSWRRSIGYVPQSINLVQGSIAKNVASFLPIDLRLMERVGRLACLEEMIAELPNGWDTIIKSGQTSLSGGQRQRIAIARALYRRPKLLILDEATSALDPGTESRMLRNLRDADGIGTILMITHKMAVAEAADEIVEILGGRQVNRRSGTIEPRIAGHTPT